MPRKWTRASIYSVLCQENNWYFLYFLCHWLKWVGFCSALSFNTCNSWHFLRWNFVQLILPHSEWVVQCTHKYFWYYDFLIESMNANEKNETYNKLYSLQFSFILAFHPQKTVNNSNTERNATLRILHSHSLQGSLRNIYQRSKRLFEFINFCLHWCLFNSIITNKNGLSLISSVSSNWNH